MNTVETERAMRDDKVSTAVDGKDLKKINNNS